jgi:hypothetical protein
MAWAWYRREPWIAIEKTIMYLRDGLVAAEFALAVDRHGELSRQRENGRSYDDLCQSGCAAEKRGAVPGFRCRRDVGNSKFETLQLNLQGIFDGGFMLSSNYMWSHSINDGSISGGDSDTPPNSYCRSSDKTSSDLDVRHLFNLSVVYSLPFGSEGLSRSGTRS